MYTDPHEDGDNILGYRGYRGYPGISSGYCKCILGYLLLWGEPSVLQTPPRPNQGGNPPWTPLFNTRLVKTGTPSSLCCSTVARTRTGTVLTYSSYIQYRTGTSSSIQCLYRIYCALLYSSLNSRIWYAYQFKKLPGIPPNSVR